MDDGERKETESLRDVDKNVERNTAVQ